MGVLVSHCMHTQFPSWGQALLQDSPAISCLQSREEALVGSDNLIIRRGVGAKGQEQEGSHTAEPLLGIVTAGAAPRLCS